MLELGESSISGLVNSRDECLNARGHNVGINPNAPPRLPI